MYRKLLEERFEDSKVYGKPVATLLYGSQNYNLHSEYSDVDTKTLVVPTLREYVMGKGKVALDVDYGVNNADKNELKDLGSYMSNLRKCNPAYLETLYTEYKVNLGYWNELLVLREDMTWSNPENLGKALRGMAYQKRAALTKPFESKLAVLAKYGFDPKQLMHCARLALLSEKLADGVSFGDALVCSEEERKHLLHLKSGELSLAEAEHTADTLLASLTLTSAKVETFTARPDVWEHVDEWMYNTAEKLLLGGK